MAAVALTGAGNLTTGFDNGSTDLTINKPSNVVEGSLMIAAVYPRLSSAAYSTPPTGWTLLSQSTDTLTGWNAFYYKVAGASEPSSYTWAGGTNGRQTGLIFIVTGADTGDLLDATGGYATKTGNDVVATSISPTTSDALLLGFAVMNTTGNDPGTYSPPTGMTTVGDSSTSTGGSDSTSYVAQEQLSASGATGTRTFSGTATATFASGQSLLTAIKAGATATDHTATPSDALGLTDIAAAAKTTVWPVTRDIQIG